MVDGLEQLKRDVASERDQLHALQAKEPSPSSLLERVACLEQQLAAERKLIRILADRICRLESTVGLKSPSAYGNAPMTATGG